MNSAPCRMTGSVIIAENRGTSVPPGAAVDPKMPMTLTWSSMLRRCKSLTEAAQ